MLAAGAATEGGPAVLRTVLLQDLVGKGATANPRTPLLIRGEPGVGKDTLARLIHAASARHQYPFIKVNCALEAADRSAADLFGLERGTSPVAARRRIGSFEFANRGTIYLDRLESLPPALVPRLLQVLRTGEVSRTGTRETTPVDVRVIASTVGCAETGSDDPRQELLRLGAIEIGIPPLRQRRDEIFAFGSFFLEQFNRRYRRRVELCPDVIATFIVHSWPGNLCELEEAVRRLVVTGSSKGGRYP